MLLVTLTRRWEHFSISSRNNFSRKKAYHERCVTSPCGHLRFFLGDGKESTAYFPSMESGSSFEVLGGRRALEQKARHWQCLPKTISHLTGTSPGHSMIPDNLEALEMCNLLLTYRHFHTQLLPAVHATGISSLPAHCPALLFLLPIWC